MSVYWIPIIFALKVHQMSRPAPRRLSPDATAQFFAKVAPLDMAVTDDQLQLADKLSAILSGLGDFDQGTIKGYLFRKAPFGKWAQLVQFVPTGDVGELFDMVRSNYGGGDFRLQIFAGGKTRGNFEFALEGPPKTTPVADGGGEKDQMNSTNLIALMIQQGNQAREQADASRREMMDQQRFAMEQQRLRDESMWKAIAVAAPFVVPLFKKESLADMVALMNANKPETTSLKDQVETLVAVKAAFGPDDKGFDPDNIAGSLARLAGPIAAAAGRAFGGRGAPPTDAGEERQEGGGDGFLRLPEADPAPAPVAAPASPGSPILRLIQPDILYFYSRRLDPGLAAEAVVDIMGRAGVTDEAVNELVGAYLGAADWKADLAAQGIDLTANPEWADDFLQELVGQWPERHRHGDGAGGRGGGLADAADDAPAGAAGVAVDDDPGPGA